MDQQSSARWLETLKREKRAKEKWQGKYLTEEEHQQEIEEDRAMMSQISGNETRDKRRTLTERDAMELRLAALDDLPEQADEKPPLADYELARLRVAQDVAASRPRNHRFTGDMSSESMLRDLGAGLWCRWVPGSLAPLPILLETARLSAERRPDLAMGAAHARMAARPSNHCRQATR